MAEPGVWAYEAGRAGPAAIAAPAGIAVLIAAATAGAGIDPGPLGARGAGAVVALAAGMAAVAAVGREHALELQLTLPVSYRVTVLRRLAPVAVAALAGGAAAAAAAAAGHPRAGPAEAVLGACGFILLMIGAGAWGAIRTGSAAGGSSLVLGVWAAKLFLLDRLAGPPALQAVLSGAGAALLVCLAVRRLGDTEALMEKGRRDG
ncbi:hypothetical protein [Nocardiopsis potens]|uniref:hypothetical protein n=1 Tax=Nocardiopsis potens TaxID=1246458 RepID=UPI0012682A74|nr:hypothetical protein [Nocardiopsis potens]